MPHEKSAENRPRAEDRARLLAPRLPGGLVTADQLETLARVIREYHIPTAQLTSGQRIVLAGIRDRDLPAVRQALGLGAEEAGHGGPSVQACPGASGCPNGLQDTLALAARLEELLGGLDLPARVRVGVSGCPRCCGESLVRDLGLVGGRGGWALAFGGNAGARPRIADVLAKNLDAGQALTLAKRLLAHYAGTAKKSQRTARFVEAQGIDSVRRALGLDADLSA